MFKKMRKVIFPVNSSRKLSSNSSNSLLKKENENTHNEEDRINTFNLSSLSTQTMSKMVLPLKEFINSSSAPVQVFVYTGTSLSIIPLVIFALWVSLTLLGSVASASILNC